VGRRRDCEDRCWSTRITVAVTAAQNPPRIPRIQFVKFVASFCSPTRWTPSSAKRPRPTFTVFIDELGEASWSGRAERRDDGKEGTIPARLFFRELLDFSIIEKTSTELCEGHVLDIGAGAGSQSIVLRRMGLPVTALDISSQAVAVAKQRGLDEVYCADIFEFQGGPFDTLLMMGHGIGMVETIAGLDRFLRQAHRLLSANGQLLLDSLDVRITEDPDNLAYHEANRKAGRYSCGVSGTRSRNELDNATKVSSKTVGQKDTYLYDDWLSLRRGFQGFAP